MHLGRMALAQYELDQALASQATESEKALEPTAADFLEPFLAEKTRKAVGHRPYSEETVGQVRTTLSGHFGIKAERPPRGVGWPGQM